MVTCPVCGGETRVTSSRSDCESVQRRRKCVDCGYKFFTSEYESSGDEFRKLDCEVQNKSKEKRGKR